MNKMCRIYYWVLHSTCRITLHITDGRQVSPLNGS